MTGAPKQAPTQLPKVKKKDETSTQTDGQGNRQREGGGGSTKPTYNKER